MKKKFYKNVLIFFVITIFIGIALPTFVYPQTESIGPGLSISPAVNNVNPGDEVEIIISNFSDEGYTVSLKPVVLYFDPANDRQDFDFIDNETVNPEEYISISSSEVFVAANSNSEISVKYIKPISGFITGVKVSKVLSSDSTSLNTSGDIISLFLDYNLSDADVLGISTSVSSTLNVQILSLAINDQFILETEIYNDSKTIIKPHGEIEVFEGEVKIGNISLTQKLNETLLPGESITIESKFTDTRSPWDRLGRITFKQNIKFDDKSSIDELDIFVLPYQVILYLIVLVIIIIFGIKIFHKRKELIVTQGGRFKNKRFLNKFRDDKSKKDNH